VDYARRRAREELERAKKEAHEKRMKDYAKLIREQKWKTGDPRIDEFG
jgi:hypothetical protein